MANVVKVEVRLPFDDALSYGPYAVNTFHVGWNSLLSSADEAMGQAQNAIMAFFNTETDGHNVAQWMSPMLNREMHFVGYDLSIPHSPGVPSPTVGTLMTPDADTGALPNEVCSCITSQCNPVTGWKRQSTYNRQYIGPLNVHACDEGGRPTDAFRTQLVAGFGSYYDFFDVIGFDHCFPVVYSTKNDDSRNIDQWWTDNVFDTQRRRKLEPSVKTSHHVG
jgi:hypothetical protein